LIRGNMRKYGQPTAAAVGLSFYRTAEMVYLAFLIVSI